MPWSKLDDGLHENAKIAAMSDKAFRLYICGITYSARHRLRGFLSYSHVAVLFKLTGAKQKHADELVNLRAWEEEAGGYRIHDHGAYNPTQEEISQKRAEAGKRGADARWQNGKPMANAISPDGKSMANEQMAKWQTDGKGNPAQTRARNPDPEPDPIPNTYNNSSMAGPLSPLPDLATCVRWATDLGREELGEEFHTRMTARGWMTLEKNSVPICGAPAAHAALKQYIASKNSYLMEPPKGTFAGQQPRRLSNSDIAAAELERELAEKARSR